MFRWREALQRWVLRHTPREASVTLGQRRIYLLPTPLGAMLLLVALAVWVGALNYAVSLAYGLAFWIAALMLVSVLLAYRQLAGLQLHAPAVLDLPLPAPHRGQLAMPVLRVWSEAPLGLVRAFTQVRLDSRLWVYPQPLAEARLPAAASDEGEADVALALPGGDDFTGLAAWQPGQSVRSIAWRVYARRGVLAAREFATPQAPGGQLCLNWDDYPATMAPEQRLSHLCWQLLQAQAAGQGLLLCLPQQALQLGPAQGDEGLIALASFGVRDAG